MRQRTVSFVLAGAAALLGVACAAAPPPPPAWTPPPFVPPPPPPAPPRATPDAEFRQAAPAPGPDVAFVPPVIQEARLRNGIDVLLVERHDLPVVVVQVVVRRGAEAGGPGLGAFAAAMLEMGTRTRSAIGISDAYEAVGAEHAVWADYDSTVASVKVLTTGLDAALEILADVVQNPAFPKEEVERERSRRLNLIAQERDRPAAVLSNAVAWALYPAGHSYRASLLGTEDAVRKIGAGDLARFHASHVVPDRATIVVAGDVTRDAMQAKLEKAFGSWKGKAAPAKPPAAPPPAAGDAARIVIVDRPGAVQTNVAVVEVGIPRSTKDFEAVLVANAILGGAFSSRLNLNLREKHAYTYGAGSWFDMRHGPGPFRAGGAIVREKTTPAVQEIVGEIDRLRSDLVAEDELADAKSYLVRRLPAQFETAGETASALAAIAVHQLPLDEYAGRAARIAAVGREDVKRVAEAYLHPDRMKIVCVGDAEAIRPGLESLAVGKVEVFSPGK